MNKENQNYIFGIRSIIEAIEAGKLMKKNKIKIDLIFCSVLQRAIETARLSVLEMNLK